LTDKKQVIFKRALVHKKATAKQRNKLKANYNMLVGLVLVAVLALLFYYQFVRPLNHFTRMGVKQTNTALPIFGDRWGVELRLDKSYYDLIKRVYFSCDKDDR